MDKRKLGNLTVSEIIDRAHRVTPVTAVQNIYSMMERDYEKKVIPYCREHNIGFVSFSPIASGYLSGRVTAETKFAGDDVQKRVPQLSKQNIAANQPFLELLSEMAKRKCATNAQISLAWMLHKYPHVVPIPGSKNKERILENLGACSVKLTDKEFMELELRFTATAEMSIWGQNIWIKEVHYEKNIVNSTLRLPSADRYGLRRRGKFGTCRDRDSRKQPA